MASIAETPSGASAGDRRPALIRQAGKESPMSMVKRYFERRIAELSRMTGYSEKFLWDMWQTECEDGQSDFNYFEGVTLALDW